MYTETKERGKSFKSKVAMLAQAKHKSFSLVISRIFSLDSHYSLILLSYKLSISKSRGKWEPSALEPSWFLDKSRCFNPTGNPLTRLKLLEARSKVSKFSGKRTASSTMLLLSSDNSLTLGGTTS
ncbi:hypothetical protein Cantr_03919 [Candida viswanathii]|uniref:Uncharacterized protein n=1 Tax=Candida viswanathii TaxID=5486 RepID=A0A367XPZ7_9ASCO|nr:hypothetical protein Cantr_03919 [Candida viswanathii]